MENQETISDIGQAAFVAGELGKLQVMEEHIEVSTKIIETGKVHIVKRVLKDNYDTEVPVFKEDVMVERRPVNQIIEGDAPGIRLDGDTTIIPILKEVIIKKILLVEELYVTKKRTETMVAVNEILRREEVTVSRTELTASTTEQ